MGRIEIKFLGQRADHWSFVFAFIGSVSRPSSLQCSAMAGVGQDYVISQSVPSKDDLQPNRINSFDGVVEKQI